MHSRSYCVMRSALLLSILAACADPVAPSVLARSASVNGPTPKAPSHTDAVLASESEIAVSWQDNSGNETGFEVHRSSNGPSGAFALRATTSANVTSYRDTGLDPGTKYCFKVRAVRTTRGDTTYSQFSNTDCETTPVPPGPPAAPSWLTADGVGADQIVLQWMDNSNNEDGFRIERCGGTEAVCTETDFTVIWTTGANAGYYADVAVQTHVTYTYRVRAFNNAGDSPPSNKATATACAEEDLCGTL